MKLMFLVALAMQQPDPWCEHLQRLAAAPREPVPFQTLKSERYRPRLLNGCYPIEHGYLCSRILLPRELTRDTAAARMAACLPGAAIDDGDPRHLVVRSPTLRVTIDEYGTDFSHVGRTMSVVITPADPPG